MIFFLNELIDIDFSLLSFFVCQAAKLDTGKSHNPDQSIQW